MKRVLVTGARGFIGQHVLRSLQDRGGYEIHATTSQSTNSRALPDASSSHANENALSCCWHLIGLLDEAQIRVLMEKVQPEFLLHLAWDTRPGLYWNSSDNFAWVRASLKLLEDFADVGGRRAVVAGTCAEYDWNYGYCSEAVTPCEPKTAYGVCKHALRLMLETQARQSGLSLAWGRIFFLYGPGEHPQKLVASIINAVLRDEPALCSHGEQIRDFLHAVDVARAFVALLESEVSGVVNVASGQPVALRDIALAVGEKIGRPDLVHLGARPTAADEPPLLVADVRRLRNEMGWSPRFDLNDGLEHAINWWKQQLQQPNTFNNEPFHKPNR